MDKRFFIFALVGGVGFVVDASILTVMMKQLHFNLYLSRSVSFTCASLTTWLLNRSLTFRDATQATVIHGTEYFKYVTVQIIGAAINLLVFVLLTLLRPELEHLPVVPLAVGAVFGLLFNFVGTRFWVYPDRGT